MIEAYGGEPETSVSVRQLKLVSIILIITVLALSGVFPADFFPGAMRAHAASNALIAINPPSQFIKGKISGTVSFEVNLTNAPAINGFVAVITYNINVLKTSSIDYSNNVLTTALCGSPPAPCNRLW